MTHSGNTRAPGTESTTGSITGPIVLATGGTGGHVFPAQALAGELRARGRTLILVSDRRGDAYHGPLGSLETHWISAAGVSGRGLAARIAAIAKLGLGYCQARALLKRLKPAVAVGFGGYPSLPTMWAATSLGFRSAIHEQNAVLGRANRLLAPRVDRIALSFKTTAELRDADRRKTIWTGNPVRPEIATLAGRTYSPPEPDGPIRLLVVGGSQGAQVLGETVPAAVAALPETLKARVQVMQQVRPEQMDDVRRAYGRAGIEAEIAPFFDDMTDKLASAHLFVGRAGASTMAELTTAGLPAILIPYAHAVDDHQTANAARLCDAAGAWMIPQGDVTAEGLAERLTQLFANPPVLAAAATAAARIGMPDATRKLADMIEALADGDDAATKSGTANAKPTTDKPASDRKGDSETMSGSVREAAE